MDVVLEQLDPERAGDAAFEGYYEVVSAAQEVDLPDEEPIAYDEVVSRLLHPFPGLGEVLHWVARHGGEVVATATVILPEHENDRVALPIVTVRPKSRRQGVGRAVLRALVPELVARGREVVEGVQLDRGGAGEAWAAALGFRTVNATIVQRLRFADVDRSLWDVPAPDGYRVETWVGAAPEEFIASYAEAKRAIGDSTRGDAALLETRWTVERVREAEAVVAERGIEQRVVVAVHEATGTVVAVTELWLQPLRKPWGYQRDTSVLATHRGHGLGRVIKAAMLRWLVVDRPDLVLVQTGTSADNVHMARVNHELGFTTVRSMVEVNRPVAGLLSGLVVEPLDPDLADEAELAAIYRLRLAAQAVDMPDEEPVTLESVVARLRNPLPGMGEARLWSGRRGGEVVAIATVLFPEDENGGLALGEIIVHPESRRQGIGTAVLRALVPELTARGRDVVEGMQVTKGGAGEAWAVAVGFRRANESILQRLVFAEVDRSLWEVPVPDGYRVERWIDGAPEELVASYASAKDAIHDAPRGDAALRLPEWTVDRVRAAEALALEQRVQERVVVAVCEETGAVVGVTELWLHPRRPRWAYQRDTAVVAAHRGHGLGRAIKAHMLRWLVADRPDLELVYTGTSADNTHMAAVNHRLGFATVRSMLEVNRPVAGLLEALGGVDAEQ